MAPPQVSHSGEEIAAVHQALERMKSLQPGWNIDEEIAEDTLDDVFEFEVSDDALRSLAALVEDRLNG